MKIRAYIALFLYTLATSGLIIQLHFCCGGLAEIGVFGELDPCACSHDSDPCEKDDACCDFETVYLIVDEAHKAPVSTEIPDFLAFASLDHQTWENEKAVVQLEVVSGPIRAGPFLKDVPLYLSQCALVYYG